MSDVKVNLSESTAAELFEREQSSAERGYYIRLLGLIMDHGANGLGLSRLDVAGLLRVLPDAVMDRCGQTHGIKDVSDIRIAVHEGDRQVVALAYHTHPDHAEVCQIGVLRLTIEAGDAALQ